MTALIVSMCAVLVILALLGMWACFFIGEAWKAWQERQAANARYTCTVSGKAWEQAMRKGWKR